MAKESGGTSLADQLKALQDQLNDFRGKFTAVPKFPVLPQGNN